ncbi:hypothetical protein J6590_034151 [Homalodisca vitripennis]|nr:hypothetical protein J6590_034151 [Homalodisca vitripennis]
MPSQDANVRACESTSTTGTPVGTRQEGLGSEPATLCQLPVQCCASRLPNEQAVAVQWANPWRVLEVIAWEQRWDRPGTVTQFFSTRYSGTEPTNCTVSASNYNYGP